MTSRLVILSEGRFTQDGEGHVWGAAAFSAPKLAWYRRVFDEVALLARVSPVRSDLSGLVPLTQEPWVEVIPLPDFVGLSGMLRQSARVRKRLRGALRPDDALVVRVPTTSGVLLYPSLRRQRRPYGVEVIGDPSEVFDARVLSPRFRPAIQAAGVRSTRSLTRHATTAMYVTQRTLQERYPPGPDTLVASATDADVPASWFRTARIRDAEQPFQVIAVASLEQPYKGVDVLLEAVARLTEQGTQVRLEVVGGGVLLPAMKAEAARLGIGERVHFCGQQGTQGVQQRLAAADLFVLPSLTEGLPRALVEAMAVGLPCIASAVGGVPELLPAEDLVTPGDAEALATAMSAMLAHPGRRLAASQHNADVAEAVTKAASGPGRETALRRLQEATLAWARRRSE